MREKKHNLEQRNGRSGFGWYGDFTSHGHRFRQFLGTDLRKAKLELGRLKAEKASKKSFPGRDFGFEEFGREFIEIYSRPNKRSWRRDEISLRHLTTFFKGLRLLEVTAQHIEEYKSQRSAKASKSTVNRELACLKTMLTKAVDWGRLERSPAAKVKLFKEPPQRDRALTEAEARRLIAGAVPHLRPLLVLLLGTGLRKGEALALRWEDVDFDGSLIRITMSKSGKARTVPISEPVRQVLVELWAERERRSEGVICVLPKPGCEDPRRLVFSGLREFKRSFKTACCRAGLKDLRPHDLRHTFATWAVKSGVDIATLSELLGHSSKTMSLRYCHASAETKAHVVQVIAFSLGPSRQEGRQVEKTMHVTPLLSVN